jgi:hypothetical protein
MAATQQAYTTAGQITGTTPNACTRDTAMLSGESSVFETGQQTYLAEMSALPPARTTVTDETINACFADESLVT